MNALALPELSLPELRHFRRLLEAEAGIHLADSKRSLVASRLGRRLRHYGYDSFGRYLEHLRDEDPDGTERQVMVECMTTNKTDFFREPHHFACLANTVFPAWRARPGAPRIWCAAAATGEEPYSIAMTLRDGYPGAHWAAPPILASDIDREVLETAARATYPIARFAAVPGDKWQHHVLRGTGPHAGNLRIRPEVRRLVEFQRINLNDRAWPLTGRFDAIFCRNVMIYFRRTLQAELLERFADLLAPGGYLFLGHSEGLHGLTGRFTPIGQTAYVLAGGGRPTPRPPAPTPVAPERPMRTLAIGGGDASAEPVVLTTLLGSCVAACLHDPVAGVGGMNHFMLPGEDRGGPLPSRFGVHAMELLINRIMQLGGDRRRLQAKVFGGGNVLSAFRGARSVADANVAFVRRFLETEGIPVVAERLGGTRPVEVRFHTATGRAQVRPLDPDRARRARHAERDFREHALRQAAAAAEVTLF